MNAVRSRYLVFLEDAIHDYLELAKDPQRNPDRAWRALRQKVEDCKLFGVPREDITATSSQALRISILSASELFDSRKIIKHYTKSRHEAASRKVGLLIEGIIE